MYTEHVREGDDLAVSFIIRKVRLYNFDRQRKHFTYLVLGIHSFFGDISAHTDAIRSESNRGCGREKQWRTCLRDVPILPRKQASCGIPSEEKS